MSREERMCCDDPRPWVLWFNFEIGELFECQGCGATVTQDDRDAVWRWCMRPEPSQPLVGCLPPLGG